MDASVVARLLEQTARAVYDARGPRAIHAGQWAVLRYLARAGRQARTVGGVATYLGALLEAGGGEGDALAELVAVPEVGGAVGVLDEDHRLLAVVDDDGLPSPSSMPAQATSEASATRRTG